jgi:Tol biopolymer transport system component
VFAGITPGKSWQIYVVSAEGGGPQQLTTGDRNHFDGCWSPDGNSLCFSDWPYLESDNATAIYLLDMRTHQVSTVQGSEGLWLPRWSPDGRYIAAFTTDLKSLMVFDFKIHEWVEWTKAVSFNKRAWSRDGKYFYFDTMGGSDPAFYRLRVSDHRVERLVSKTDLGRQAAGDWFGLAPDDSLLALRDIGTQEIYALDWEAP